MNTFQRAFVASYLCSRNAQDAARESGIELKASGVGYYVYFLIDPRDYSIFYVGKGIGKRHSAHLAQHASRCNPLKELKIRQIRNLGFEPISAVFADQLSEEDALELEGELLDEFSGMLTNIVGGPVSQLDKQRASAESMLAALVPFQSWLATCDPQALKWAEKYTGSAEKFYNKFRNELISLRDGNLYPRSVEVVCSGA